MAYVSLHKPGAADELSQKKPEYFEGGEDPVVPENIVTAQRANLHSHIFGVLYVTVTVHP